MWALPEEDPGEGSSGAAVEETPAQTLLGRVKRVFFENRSWKQTLVRNTIWATVSEGSARLLKIVQVLLVVRYFGPTEYGKFAFAFAYAAMAAIIFDAGLVTAATREFSANREKEELFTDIALMKLLLGFVGMAAL